jgi:molecular chaperone DnaK
MSKIIGIDLGTTKSVVAVMEGNEPRIIVNEEGSRLTPSVVAWDDSGEILVGQSAKRQAVTNPLNTVCSAKRFIGRRHEASQEEGKRVPCTVQEGKSDDAVFLIRGKVVTPPEVSARVLMKLKNAAEAHLGEEVTLAVITVPAYFDESQRQATKDAGALAGLEVVRLVSDAAAAGLAYGLDKKNEELIAVYDLGGGTFEISILEVGDNVVQAISTNGDTHLGGDDVDHLILDWLVAEFKKDTGIDVAGDKMVVQRLRDAAEQAKIELSSVQETTMTLPFLASDASGPRQLQKQLSRSRLEQMMRSLIERTLERTREALADARKTPQEINEVVLVGGSTRIPLVQEMVKKLFGKQPRKGVNPDEIVALGAAVQAGILSGDVKGLAYLAVTPFSFGVETLGGVMTTMIGRNTMIPTQKKEIFSTAADGQSSIEIHVLQGDRTEAQHDRTLGKLRIEGIRPAPRGVPRFELTFDISAAGALSVFARDPATGKEHKIALAAKSGRSEVGGAAEHEAKDTTRREQHDDRGYAIVKVPSEKAKKVPVATTSGGAPVASPAGDAHPEQDLPPPQQQTSNGPPTVLGLKLMPGERVIYFLGAPRAKTARDMVGAALGFVALLAVCLGGVLLLLVVALGMLKVKYDGTTLWQLAVPASVIVFLWATISSWRSPAQVVTTQRLIEFTGGRSRGVPLGDVRDLESDRRWWHGKRNVFSLATAALGDSLVDPCEPRYWAGATCVLLMRRRFRWKTHKPQVLGPFLAKCIIVPGFVDRCATVPYEA